MNEAMECCACGKLVVLERDKIPPTWFASYDGYKMVKVIHADCYKKPEYKKIWRGE